MNNLLYIHFKSLIILSIDKMERKKTSMKKLIAFMLALVMVLALAACGGSANKAPAKDGAAVTTAVEGVLTMGTNAEFPPYEYYENDKIVGIDAEIAAAIADKLGLTLEIQDMAFDSIIPAITSGKVDVGLAGMTVTEDRLVNVDFSTTYATGVQAIIVTEDSPITSVDDLFGDGNYTIGVQLNTTGDLYSTWDIEDEGLGSVDRYNRGADAVAALISGKVDCVIIDNQPALAFVEANEGLKVLETEYAVEDYAIAMDKGSALLDPIDSALEELIANGTVKAIIDKYIK